MGLSTEPTHAGEATASSPIERLLDVFETHVALEAESLASYQWLADQQPDPETALLMRLVLEDEERHHALLRRMATSLRDSIQWQTSPDALPVSTGFEATALPTLLATTRDRLREEHQGARQLRRLARTEGQLMDGLFGLLLGVMAMDSEKHEHILRFILHRLESRA